METKLDFSLPEKKAKKSVASFFTIILLLVLIGLVSINVFVKPSGKSLLNGTSQTAMTPDQMKELASKLAQRSLYTRAVELWKEYLANANLTDIEAKNKVKNLRERAKEIRSLHELGNRPDLVRELRDIQNTLAWHKANKNRSKFFKWNTVGASQRRAIRHPETTTLGTKTKFGNKRPRGSFKLGTRFLNNGQIMSKFRAKLLDKCYWL